MNRRSLCWAACLVWSAAALPATPEWGGSVTVSSNYLLRGVSRSYNDPALSMEVHAQTAGGLFGSLWASSSRALPDGPTSAELGVTAGIVRALDDNWSLRGSWSHYESPWTQRSGFYAYDELTAQLQFRERLNLSVSYSPNTSRYAPGAGAVWHRSATAFEASFQQDLRDNLRGYAGLGYQELSSLFGTGYWYGNVGIAWSRGRWSTAVSYVYPDDTARRLTYPGGASRRVLASLSFDF